MKMHPIYPLSVLLSLSLMFSCKTISNDDFKVGQPNSQRLPIADIQIDESSLEYIYSSGSTISNASVNRNQGLFPSPFLISDGVTVSGVSTNRKDKRINDTKLLLDREIKNNIFDETLRLPKNSQAKIKVVNGQSQVRGYGWLVGSIFTAFIPNLFGMPLHTYKTELEIELELKDCHNNVIGRYTGSGNNETLVAMWHGYDNGFFENTGNQDNRNITGIEGGARKSNIEAVKQALTEIRQKVGKDYEKLNIQIAASCK